MTDIEKTPSSYMNYLPAIFREGEVKEKANFLGRFLKIYEKILSGIDDGVNLEENKKLQGIEQIIRMIHDYFDPLFTPGPDENEPDSDDFVSYLAGWVALTCRQTWPQIQRRRVLANIVPLYKKRGTKDGLTEFLRLFVGPQIDVEEVFNFEIGRASTVGEDSIVGGFPPYVFSLDISYGFGDEGFELGILRNLLEMTKDIVDLEKPAHTSYASRYDFPGIMIGDFEEIQRSVVARNTLIWSKNARTKWRR